MGKEIISRLKEATLSIVPIVLVVILLNYIFPDINLESNQSLFGPVLTSLLISTIPLILGTALFSIGIEKSVAKIGEVVGKTLTKRKSIIMLLIVGVLMGFLVTIAEPDLSVLAARISENGTSMPLILVASFGVGLFLMVAILRVLLNKSLKVIVAVGYGLVFTLGLFADKSFFSIVFDAGGVTTGVVTTPFILALSMGVAHIIGGKNAEDASFGYSGLCTLGTVLAVMLFSIVLNQTGGIRSIQTALENKFLPNGSNLDSTMVPLNAFSEMPKLYLYNFLNSLKDVALSVLPILAFFLLFNIYVKIKGREFASIMVGFGYTFIGLVLFFLGAESGFIPVGASLGKNLASANILIVILIVAILGFISMMAEPSVKILANNVSEVSRGVISKRTILIALGIASAIALLLNTVRINYNIEFIYFIIPLYIVAIALAFISPEIYVGISIDAAGVATGTMASCFFLPMFISYAVGRGNTGGSEIMGNGFGIIGLMAVMPIIVVEIVGCISVVKSRLAYNKALAQVIEVDDSQVIHLPNKLQGAK